MGNGRHFRAQTVPGSPWFVRICEAFFFACMVVKPEPRAFDVRNVRQHVIGRNRSFPILNVFRVNECVFIDHPPFNQQHGATEPIKI